MAAAVSGEYRRSVGPVRVDPGQLAGMAVLCIDNDPQILDGMKPLLGDGAVSVLMAPDLPAAITVIDKVETHPERVAGRLSPR